MQEHSSRGRSSSAGRRQGRRGPGEGIELERGEFWRRLDRQQQTSEWFGRAVPLTTT